MRRLSLPLHRMQSHYSVVVVGSGYGGAVAASRLARAGQQVCLLERGKEFQPGEYPNTEAEALAQLQADLPMGPPLCRTGLFDFRINEEINVLLGCGLGGTSLVNANVSLRPEPRVFEDERWPLALRKDRTTLLDQSFTRVQEMLAATPYPDEAPALHKYQALKRSAQGLGPVYHPPINVSFKDGINAQGVEQKACNACGDCVSGCNVGAKNTLIMNYLPDAIQHGAEIYTCASVRYLQRENDRWRVYFQVLETGFEPLQGALRSVSADQVILGAGSLGSTEILLRSRRHGLVLSEQLGRRFTGNGDVLGFAYNSDQTIDGIGFGNRSPQGRNPVGPCITGIIDLREQANFTDGMVIEEGSIPGALASFLPKILGAAALAVGEETDGGFQDKAEKRAREWESLIRGPYQGATRNTQTFLAMSHDDSSGQMVLENDRLRIHWPGVGQQPIFKEVNQRLKEATRSLGGTYVKNPGWSEQLGQGLITVHPLGGCVMAERAEDGVVNHAGQVFAGSDGTALHPGLVVLDGAIIPRSLGVNPLLTISALAERSCAVLAEQNGWLIDYRPGPAQQAKVRGGQPVAERPGIRFTETMRGHFALDSFATHTAAEQAAQQAGTSFEFVVTVISQDLESMLADPEHRAEMVGVVRAPVLSAAPMTISNGQFRLFTRDPDHPTGRRMEYQMDLQSDSGKSFRLVGFKRIQNDPGLDLWADTTTLYIDIFNVDEAGEANGTIGQGILHILPADFARQLTTIQVTHAPDPATRLLYLAKFGTFFAGTLFETYASVFAHASRFDPQAPPRKLRLLRVPAPEVYPFAALDGELLRLTRYRGGDKGPVILSHGLGVSSRIFSIDTIETNLLEFLVAYGFDVWLLDYRASIELPAAKTRFNADDIARLDYPAAVDKVRAVTGADSVQMVVHCFGATTFFMAMLNGLAGVRSAVCSQIATHIRAPIATRIKSGLYLPTFLDLLGIGSLNAYVDTHADWLDRLFDKALKLQLLPVAEQCSSAVCHRISFIYAPLYEHDQLNASTHDALHELFGIANIESLDHLARLVRVGHLVSAQGQEIYMPHLGRLAIPISFIHGAQNACFDPKSTELTVQALRAKNGDLYERHLIPGYGHIDCIFGKNAARDVYPYIVAHLQRFA